MSQHGDEDEPRGSSLAESSPTENKTTADARLRKQKSRQQKKEREEEEGLARLAAQENMSLIDLVKQHNDKVGPIASNGELEYGKYKLRQGAQCHSNQWHCDIVPFRCSRARCHKVA